MKLYVTRHGQTEWNAQNKVLGRNDMELTQNGVEQAQALALKLEDKKIDLIIASPLLRARTTAQIIANETGAKVILEDRLIEQDYGDFEGVHRDHAEYLVAKKEFAYKMPKGESVLQVAHRIYSVLDEIKEKYQDLTILIVAHGGVIRVLDTYFNDMTQEQFFNYLMGNCGFKEYEL